MHPRGLRALMWEVGGMRIEMAAKEFADYRRQLEEHSVFLSLSVLVPICPDCWVFELRNPPDIPHVSADNWGLDLVLLGFDLATIEHMKEDIREGVGEERGPYCHVCHRWLPYWQDEDGCFVQKVTFTDYFGFDERETHAVSKDMKKRIIRMYGLRCFACGVQLTPSDLTIDHIIPRSLSGTGDQTNLQPLCQGCNTAKANDPPAIIEATLHFPMRPVPSDAYEGVVW